jgi:flagellar motility protein MotE (MotC chaperone)
MRLWKTPRRVFRLLPGVVVVGAALLVLNTSGLIHGAYAGIDTAAPQGALAPPAAPQNKDFAGDEGQTASASEVDVLTSLAKRRSELDAREAQLQAESAVLAATESRVDAKIAQLKSLQSQITALVVQRDAAQEKQLGALVKTYSAMKAKDAARIFDNLNDDVLLAVAQEMKSDALAPVLAAMTPDQAQKLTLKLANKLALPATADLAAAAVPAAADTAKPGTQAAQAPPAPAKPAPKSGG